MKAYYLLISGLLGLGTTNSAAIAADAAAGAELHQAHCTTCHDDAVYTRDDRKVTTPVGLRKQINRCQLSLGLQWFDDDISNVEVYLNNNYYHFK